MTMDDKAIIADLARGAQADRRHLHWLWGEIYSLADSLDASPEGDKSSRLLAAHLYRWLDDHRKAMAEYVRSGHDQETHLLCAIDQLIEETDPQ